MSSSPTPESPLISTHGLSVSYGTGLTALQATDLQLQRGEILVLLGRSGAGKSTLLRALNGLVRPSSGEVRVHDLGLSLNTPAALRAHRQRTGMVFQQHHLIGRQTVLANVLMGTLGRRRLWASLLPWSLQDKRLALDALDRVGLLDKALARADTLSGGQQQRVGVARALVQQPRLLLADEPVASLDPHTAEQVLSWLHGICRRDGLAAVISLHQLDLARRFADRIVGLHQGAVVFDGPPQALDAAAEARLYASLADPEHTSPSMDRPIPDSAPSLTPRAPFAQAQSELLT